MWALVILFKYYIVLFIFIANLFLSFKFFDKNSFFLNRNGVFLFKERLEKNQIYTIFDFFLDLIFLSVNLVFLITTPFQLLRFLVIFILLYFWVLYSFILIFLNCVIIVTWKIFFSFDFKTKLSKIEVIFYSKHSMFFYLYKFQFLFANQILKNYKLFFKKKTFIEVALVFNRFFIVTITGFSIKVFELFPVINKIIEDSLIYSKNEPYGNKFKVFKNHLIKALTLMIIKNHF